MDEYIESQLLLPHAEKSLPTSDSENIFKSKEIIKKRNKKKKMKELRKMFNSPTFKCVGSIEEDNQNPSSQNRKKLQGIIDLNMSTFEDIVHSLNAEQTEVGQTNFNSTNNNFTIQGSIPLPKCSNDLTNSLKHPSQNVQENSQLSEKNQSQKQKCPQSSMTSNTIKFSNSGKFYVEISTCKTNVKTEERMISKKTKKHHEDKSRKQRLNLLSDLGDFLSEDTKRVVKNNETPRKKRRHSKSQLENCTFLGLPHMSDDIPNITHTDKNIKKQASQRKLKKFTSVKLNSTCSGLKLTSKNIQEKFIYDLNSIDVQQGKNTNLDKKKKFEKEVKRKRKKSKTNQSIMSMLRELENPDDSDWNPSNVKGPDHLPGSEDKDNFTNKSIAKKNQLLSKVTSSSLTKMNKNLVYATPFSTKKEPKNYSIFENPSSFVKKFTDDESAGDLILEEIQCQMVASERDLEKLKSLEIHIDWKLSPLHRIDTGSCKVPRAKLREILGPAHEKFLSEKKFSAEDENKVKQSWEEFSSIYRFNNPELFYPTAKNFGIFKKRERHKFKLFLAKYLPDRHLLSVYKKFVRIYSHQKTGRWSLNEDRLLMKIYHDCKTDDHSSSTVENKEKLGLSMKTIMTRALNRSYNSIDARLKILLRNDYNKNIPKQDIAWTPELEGAVIHYLVKKSKVESIEDLRYATVTYKVWREVCSKLVLPFDKVVNHWKYHLYPQIFARQPVARDILKTELIKWFYNSDIKYSNQIDWRDLSKRAGDLGSCNLSKIFITLIRNFVPKQLHNKFRESVVYLHDNYKPQLQMDKASALLIRKEYNPETLTLSPREEEENALAFTIESSTVSKN